jgi:hypothetical protein
MPQVYGVDGSAMALEDLKKGDILVVCWKDSVKYNTETSVVRFEKLSKISSSDRWIFMSSADFDSLGPCSYPIENILEMRFCARDSSASSQIFSQLHELHKKNRMLMERLKTIRQRFMRFVE